MSDTLALSIITIFVSALATSAFGYWGFWRQTRAELQKDYERKLNEKKWELYVQFTDIIIQMLQSTKLKGKRREQELSKLVSPLYGFAGSLMLIGSDDVVRAFNEFRRSTLNNNQEDKLKLLNNVMAVVVAMRRDLGYASTDLAPEDLLRIVINDIDQIIAEIESQ